MSEPDYDILVIGGGPGGYTAAIRAAQLGLRAAVVEREHLGGICANWGCIPTKAMLRSTEMLDHCRHLLAFGLSLEGRVSADLPAIVARARGSAERMNKGVGGLLRKNKVDVIWGEARLTGPGAVEVTAPGTPPRQPQPPVPRGVKGAGSYTARHVIVATGARPRALPGLTPDGDRIWTYFEALAPDALPDRLIVVGAGAIGMEFASIYAALGSEVTVIEMAPRILPAEDAEISDFVRAAFRKRGVSFRTESRVDSVEIGADGVAARLSSGETLHADRLLSAAGAVANTEGLGLDDLGVRLHEGVIATDRFGATNIAGLHAIGDVAGPPMLAHKAEHEATICVEAIAGAGPHPLHRARIPACTYCQPQVASVGLTEAEAQAAGHAVRVGRFPFQANGKAIALGDDQGLAKTVFDATTGALLGAHLVGPEVTELIHGMATAMELETTEAELFDTVFPHPTLSETLKQSALTAHDRAINI